MTNELSWRKSSFSGGQGGDCVEVGRVAGTVMVRDTKDHGRGQVHAFTAKDWHAFVVGVKAGTTTDR
jgi:hypothetical protein